MVLTVLSRHLLVDLLILCLLPCSLPSLETLGYLAWLPDNMPKGLLQILFFPVGFLPTGPFISTLSLREKDLAELHFDKGHRGLPDMSDTRHPLGRAC